MSIKYLHKLITIDLMRLRKGDVSTEMVLLFGSLILIAICVLSDGIGAACIYHGSILIFR